MKCLSPAVAAVVVGALVIKYYKVFFNTCCFKTPIINFKKFGRSPLLGGGEAG